MLNGQEEEKYKIYIILIQLIKDLELVLDILLDNILEYLCMQCSEKLRIGILVSERQNEVGI